MSSSQESIVVTAIFGILAVVLLLIGYLIRERGKVHLLAGYDPRRVADPRGLARYAGAKFYLMAAITLLVPIVVGALGSALPDDRVVWEMVAVGYTVAILGICLWLVVGARRFMR